jgi:transposase
VARQEDYGQRQTVERSFAWLGSYRRLLIRWERLFNVCRSFFTVALLTVCLKRLTQEGKESGCGVETGATA